MYFILTAYCRIAGGCSLKNYFCFFQSCQIILMHNEVWRRSIPSQLLCFTCKDIEAQAGLCLPRLLSSQRRLSPQRHGSRVSLWGIALPCSHSLPQQKPGLIVDSARRDSFLTPTLVSLMSLLLFPIRHFLSAFWKILERVYSFPLGS